MPTPAIYADPAWDAFAQVPPALRSADIPVMYVTDRAPAAMDGGGVLYGAKRSRSAAFGEAVVRVGDGLAWEDLVEASRSAHRARALPLELVLVTETARFGMKPPTLVISDAELSGRVESPEDTESERAGGVVLATLDERLAMSPSKTVFIFVHGFNNSFEDAVLLTAQFWHFLGREGVPVCYSWPAGVGALRGYEYSVASSEFTVNHFKDTLRLIASSPGVERINILAHSRGTAVVTDAIRELFLETRDSPDDVRSLKLGTVVLAAADLDIDVMVARNGSLRVGRAAERLVLYVSLNDDALALSGWLFGGVQRVGNVDFDIFSPAEVDTLRHSQRLQIIGTKVSLAGALGHSYYHASPAVSSDIILLLRYGLPPGGSGGRPLGVDESGLWLIDDAYPGSDWRPPAKEPTP